MRITQVHQSKSVERYPVKETYGLSEYNNPNEPAIFFGLYHEEDIELLLNHKGLAVIRWCGRDSNFPDWNLLKKPNIHSCTPLKIVQRVADSQIGCKLIGSLPPKITGATPNGNMVYAYIPKGAEKYSRMDIVEKLTEKYQVIIGDGSVDILEWRNGKSLEYYNKCFIGLFLSHLSGGAAGISEMGVLGKRVVTNVSEGKHCLPWNTIVDIEAHIEREKRLIGYTNHYLASAVINQFSDDMGWLDTNYYT